MSKDQSAKPLDKRRKALATILVFVVTVTALIGGTVAQYTDRTGTPSAGLVAGTVDLEISDSTNHQAWVTAIKPMAPGDTFTRYLDLNNVGNLEVTDLTVAQENGGGTLVDGAHGVQIAMHACTVPWDADNTCTGTEYAEALPFTPLTNITGVVHLELPNIMPASALHMKLVTRLPESAPNSYQGEESWVRYTFGVIQRGPNRYNADDTVEPIAVTPLPLEEPELTAVAQSEDTVFLDWNNVPNATDFRVERSLDPADPLSWVIVSAGTNTQLLDRSVEPGVTYYYRVKTFGKGGGTAYSNTASVTTPMANVAPTFENQPTTSSSTTSMPVSWSEVEGASYYTLEYSTDPFTSSGGGGMSVMMFKMAAASTKVAYTGPATTTTVTGLTPATTYYFRVTATGPGRTTVSLPMALTTGMDAPNLLTVAAADSATLAWSRPVGAVDFKLLRSNNVSMDSATILYEGSATSYTDTTLQDGKAYYYQVRARSANDIVTKSAAKQVSTTLVAPTLTFPTVTASSIDFEWTSSTGATAYRLERSLTGYFTASDAETLYLGPGTSYSLNDLEPAFRAYYRITAIVSTSGFTASAQPVAVSTKFPPTNTETSTDGATVTVEWDVEPGFIYTVKRNACGTTPYTTLATGLTASPYTDTTTVAGQTYCYKIVTELAPVTDPVTGEPLPEQPEENTDPITGDPLPEPEQEEEPQAPVVVEINKPVVTLDGDPGAVGIGVKWAAVPNATAYRVEISADGSTWNTAATTAGTSQQVTGLLSSTAYYFRVTATDGVTSATSLPLSAHTKIQDPYVGASAALDGSGLITVISSAPRTESVRIERSLSASFADSAVIHEGTATTLTDPLAFPGRRVYYRITALDAFGQEAASSTSVLASLAPPTLTATPVSESLVTLSWTAVTGAESYVVERASTLAMTDAVTVHTTGSTAWSDTTVSVNTRYYYRVRAVSPDTTATSPQVTLKTGVDSSTLSVGTVTRDSVVLSWNNTDDVTSYSLERSATSNFASSTTVYSGVAKTYTNAGLASNTQFYYRVKATGANGLVSTSPVVTATTLKSQVEAVVTNTTDTAVTLTWQAIDGATSYKVEGSSSNFGAVIYNQSFTALTATISQTVNTSRYYRVTAMNGTSVVGEVSVPVQAVTKLGTAPTLTLTKPAAYALNVAWTTGSGATTYLIERGPSDSGPWTQIATSGGSSYTDSNLSGAQTYYYRVTAVGLAENKVSTNTVSGYPVLATPTGYNQGTVTSTSVPMTWNAVKDADQYVIERGEGNSWPTATNTVTVATTTSPSYTDSTVVAGTQYVYRLTPRSSVSGSTGGTSFLTPLVPLTNPVLSGTVASKDTISLTWAAVPGANSYRVERWTNAAPTPTTVFTTSATSWTNTGLVPGTVYYYRLVAVGKDTTSTSAQQTFTTSFGAPVITLPANQAGPNYTITWPAAGQVTGYLAQYASTSDFATPTTAATLAANATTYTYTTLPSSGTVYVRLVAYNATLNDASNSIAIATPFPVKPTITLGTPTTTYEDLAADAGREAAVTSTLPLSWTEVPGAEYYDIYTSATPTGIFDTVPVARVMAPSLSGSISFPTGKGTYVAVKAGAANGSSSLSTNTPSIMAPGPAVPVLSAVSTGGNSISVVMPKLQYSADYNVSVYASETASPLAATVLVGRINPNTVTNSSRITLIGGLAKQGTTYYIHTRVTTGATTVLSPNSIAVTTAPAEPLVTVSSLGPTAGDTVSWNSVVNAAGYNLYAVTGPTETALNNKVLLYSGSATSFNVPAGSVSTGYVVNALLQDGSETHYGYGFLLQKSVPQFTFNHRDEVTYASACSGHAACDFFEWNSVGNPSKYVFFTWLAETNKTSPVYGFPKGTATSVNKENYTRYQYNYYFAPGSPDAYYAITANNPFGAVLNATAWKRVRAHSR